MKWYWWVGTVQIAIALIAGLFGIWFVTADPIYPFDDLNNPLKTTKVAGFVKGTLFTAATLILADVIIGAMPYAPSAFRKLLQLVGLQVAQVVIAALVVLVGSLAFKFKRANQATYGIVKVIVAAATAIAAVKNVNNIHDFGGVAFSLAATVYVVSRGLGNYRDGKKRADAVIVESVP
jgi:hypothetical protein